MVIMDWHTLLKIVSGIFVVPLAIIARQVWPWWERTPIALRIISGIFILPFVGIAALLSNWWNTY